MSTGLGLVFFLGRAKAPFGSFRGRPILISPLARSSRFCSMAASSSSVRI